LREKLFLSNPELASLVKAAPEWAKWLQEMKLPRNSGKHRRMAADRKDRRKPTSIAGGSPE